ncbi:MAG: hypothetical protein ACRDP6_23670 [Actinoallomurus sp.]
MDVRPRAHPPGFRTPGSRRLPGVVVDLATPRVGWSAAPEDTSWAQGAYARPLEI